MPEPIEVPFIGVVVGVHEVQIKQLRQSLAAVGQHLNHLQERNASQARAIRLLVTGFILVWLSTAITLGALVGTR